MAKRAFTGTLVLQDAEKSTNSTVLCCTFTLKYIFVYQTTNKTLGV